VVLGPSSLRRFVRSRFLIGRGPVRLLSGAYLYWCSSFFVDAEANRMFMREYRKPFVVPDKV